MSGALPVESHERQLESSGPSQLEHDEWHEPHALLDATNIPAPHVTALRS